MDLKSIFQRDKSASSAPLPQPPSVREMLEDIENSSKNDPVYLFANYLQRKGKSRQGSVGLDGDSVNSSSSSLTSHTRSTSKGRRSRSESESATSPVGSPFGDMEDPAGFQLDGSSSNGADTTESIYYKLRQFISLNEQTQETTTDIEMKLRQFELENKEFIQVLNDFRKDSGRSSRKSSLT